jgi:hypothetical protein
VQGQIKIVLQVDLCNWVLDGRFIEIGKINGIGRPYFDAIPTIIIGDRTSALGGHNGNTRQRLGFIHVKDGASQHGLSRNALGGKQQAAYDPKSADWHGVILARNKDKTPGACVF